VLFLLRNRGNVIRCYLKIYKRNTQRLTSDEEQPSKIHPNFGKRKIGMWDRFYSFNGAGGEYDGAAAADEYYGTAAADGAAADDAGGTSDAATGLKEYNRILSLYFKYGKVPSESDAQILRKSFPVFKFAVAEQPTAFFGSGSYMTDPIDRENLVTSSGITYIPQRSVLPVRGRVGDIYGATLGPTMSEFLNEVGRVFPKTQQETITKDRERGVKIFNKVYAGGEREPNGDDDEDDDSDGDEAVTSKRPKENLSQELLTVMAIYCQLPHFAPWKERAQLQPTNPPGACAPSKIELTVRDDIFTEYVAAYRSERTVNLMRNAHNTNGIVALVLEAEADVWTACGGSFTHLPNAMWISKRAVVRNGEHAPRKVDMNELFQRFLAEQKADVGLKDIDMYFGDHATLESQVFSELGGSTDKKEEEEEDEEQDEEEEEEEEWKKEETLKIVKSFYKWCDTNGFKKNMELRLTDVLSMGGLVETNREGFVNEAADWLLCAAVCDRCVKNNASNATEQILFANSWGDTGDIRYAYDDTTSASFDESDKRKIINAFRRGKEKVLREATLTLGHEGGDRAMLITDPECRHHFIALCRANYHLKLVSTGGSVVTDRRRRILDQERVTRECLHFFQMKNGTGTRISSSFTSR